MSLDALLRLNAREHAGRAAIIDLSGGGAPRRLSFSELQLEVARAAGWLRRQGVRKGDGVLVFVPMGLDLYVALLALFRIGAVALFLDPSAGVAHLERCCRRWQPAALLAVRKAHLLRLRSPVLRRIPLKISVGGWLPRTRSWLAGPSAPPVEEGCAAPGDPALVTFTSGSTGVPKAAVRTQGFLLAQYEALAPCLDLRPGDIDLATLPVFTLANLAAGATTVVPRESLRRPGAVSGASLHADMQAHGVTRITASPALLERLVEHARPRSLCLPLLRHVHTGGAPVFPRLLASLAGLAPAARIVSVYGSTEAEPIAEAPLADLTPAVLGRMGEGGGLYAGHPVASLSLRILHDRWGAPRPDLDGAGLEAETLPAGAVGEIVVSGDHVLPGYLGGLGDEETKFRVAGKVWHRTGDAGLLDAEGRLWLQGRCAARISDDRGVAYPFALECAAMEVSGVRRAAFVRHGGERILVVDTDLGEDVLGRALAPALRAAGVARLVRMPGLPVDARHNAKTDYTALALRLGRLRPLGNPDTRD